MNYQAPQASYKRKKISFCFLFLLIFCHLGVAQYQFEQIKFSPLDEGFINRGIRTINQDKDGYIWIGCEGTGLYRFDGNNHTQFVYKHQDSSSIDGNFISSSLIDDSNRMWIGTNHGLNLYNPEMSNFKRIKAINKTYNNNLIQIKSIYQVDEENLLLGTINLGIVKYNINTEYTTLINLKANHDSPINITNILKFDGNIFAFSSLGILKYNEQNDEFEPAEFVTKSGITKVSFSIESAIVDKENNLWIGTDDNGLIRLSKKDNFYQKDHFKFTSKKIMSFLLTKENNLFFSAENEGLYLIEKDTNQSEKVTFKKFNKDALKSNSVWSLFQDSQSRIWLGTFYKGVLMYDRLFDKFKVIKNLNKTDSLQERAVSNLIEDNLGNIWIAIDGGGISIYNPKTKQIEAINSERQSKFEGLTSNAVIELFQDREENIWVGTWEGGIYFLKKGSKKFVNYTKANTNESLTSNRIHSYAQDSKGRIWIGTSDSGLIYMDTEKKTFQHCNSKVFRDLGMLNLQIRSIKIDKEDNVWIGSNLGLFKVSFEEDKSGVLNFKVTSKSYELIEASKNNPNANIISSIYITDNNQILLGTEGAGLYIIDHADSIRKYTNRNYSEEVINSIFSGENNTYWVSGSQGIANISLNSENLVTYDDQDGFRCNTFYIDAICSSEDGTIFYGNGKDLNYFRPDQTEINNKAPELHFTNFKIFNQDITPFSVDSPLTKDISKTKEITISHDQRVFSIDYVGINFTRPEKNQYAYQMEGVDPVWRFVGNNRSATYSNMKPGAYIFRMKASNNDNVWSPEPLELAICILPPWWDSTLAHLAYAVLLFLIICVLFKYSKNRINTKQSIQIERQKRLQEEKSSKQKLEFFTNISHEFRTPLTLIINPLEDIVNDKSVELPNPILRKAKIAYKNSFRLNRLINELMDFRKIESDKMTLQVAMIELIEEVQLIMNYFKEEAITQKINLEFKSEIPSVMVWLDKSMLEKIIFNLLSNAMKITPKNGSITVSVVEKKMHFPNSNFNGTKEGVEISIEDTGGGLTKSEISKIFQRFSQINITQNTHYGGTGIGLEITKAMTILLRGNINVSSKIGKGSNFKVSFLLGREHFEQEEIIDPRVILPNSNTFNLNTSIINPTLERKIQSTDKNNPSTLNEHTLLVVEDNIDLRNYLEIQLEEDYNIITAENGKVGFELAISKSPHLILTDVMMPVSDGFELCNRIKTDLKTSHIPLVMLTARAMRAEKLKGINLGADAYLTKPIEMDLLKSTISQLLSSRQILIDKFSKQNEIDHIPAKKIGSLDNVFIKNLIDYIFERIDDTELSVELIANHFFLSRSQLYRKTKALTGSTVNELIRKIRLEEALKMIEVGDGNIGEISFKVGFKSQSYFAKCFKDEFGKLPKEII